MQITITAGDGDDATALGNFYSWLGRDDDVVRAGSVSMSSSGATGTMGALDVIDVVLTQSVALAQLAMAYAAWRNRKKDAPPLAITANGTTVVLADGSPETLARILALGERSSSPTNTAGSE